MNDHLITTLSKCPQTMDYLTLDENGECPLCWDIDNLQEFLPKLVTTLGEPKDDAMEWKHFISSVGWVIRHLQTIRDELRKGGGE